MTMQNPGVGRSVASTQRYRVLSALRAVPPSIFVAAGLLVVAFLLVPAMLGIPFQMVILRQAAPIGLAICAQLLVIRVNSIDLSIGGVFVLVNYITSSGMLSGYPDGVVILAPVLAGALIGAINGFFVTVFRSTAVIVTLATGAILLGLVLYLSSGAPPGSVNALIRWLGTGRLGPVPFAVLIWLALAAVLGLALRFLVYGQLVRVIGANIEAAMTSGIPVAQVLFVSHVLAGVFSALGGLLMAGYIGMGSVRLGIDVVMMSIAGVILGGITFGGGRRGIFGAMVAAYALAFLFNIMTALRFGEPSKMIVQGGVVAFASIVASLSLSKTR